MFFGPVLAPVNLNIHDRDPLCHAFAVDGDSQPLFSLGSFDLVAVAPAIFVILHIIVEDEQISLADLVEIAAPGDVGWL